MNPLILSAMLLAAPQQPAKYHDTQVYLHGAIGHDLGPNIMVGLSVEPDPSTEFYLDVTYQARQTFRQETSVPLSWRYAQVENNPQMPMVDLPEIYARERVQVKLGARWRVH